MKYRLVIEVVNDISKPEMDDKDADIALGSAMAAIQGLGLRCYARHPEALGAKDED